MSYSAWLLGLAQLIFIINIIISLRKEKDAKDNHWDATTLDWAATTSPPLGHGNFTTEPVVYRDPYEYSVPGNSSDYLPQNQS